MSSQGNKSTGRDVKAASAAARYGNAIFELAREARSVAQVEKELLSLNRQLVASATLSNMIASPLIGAGKKAAVMLQIAKKGGFSTLVSHFIAVACENGRAADLGDMVHAFIARSAEAKGHVQAKAITAAKLSTAQKTRLTAGLKKAIGQNVKLDTELDPGLLGGLVVQVGSKMYDSSLKAQLAGLKLAMKES